MALSFVSVLQFCCSVPILLYNLISVIWAIFIYATTKSMNTTTVSTCDTFTISNLIFTHGIFCLLGILFTYCEITTLLFSPSQHQQSQHSVQDVSMETLKSFSEAPGVALDSDQPQDMSQSLLPKPSESVTTHSTSDTSSHVSNSICGAFICCQLLTFFLNSILITISMILLLQQDCYTVHFEYFNYAGPYIFVQIIICASLLVLFLCLCCCCCIACGIITYKAVQKTVQRNKQLSTLSSQENDESNDSLMYRKV